MKKENRFLFVALINVLLLLGVVSCKKADYYETKPTKVVSEVKITDIEIMNNLPTFKDGRLVFKDSISYANYVLWLFDNQNDTEKILGINRNLGFVCMNEIYDKGIDMLSDLEATTCPYIESYPNVFYANEIDGSIIQDMQASVTIGYIANEFGIFQVGDKIIRSSYNYNYCITDGDETLIPTLIKLNGSKSSIKNITSSEARKQNTQIKNQYAYRTSYFSNDSYRAVARLHHIVVPQFSNRMEYQAEVDAQKKVAGIWLCKKLDDAWLSWNSGYYYSYLPNSIATRIDISSDVFGGSNKQKVRHVFCQHGTDINIYEELSSLTTTHKVKYNNEYAIITFTNAFTGAY